ncbi:MAG: CinA family protein, partial [Faecalibacillus sp.]
DICVSFTGNAGPEAMEGKPVGEVYVGLNYLGDIAVYQLHLNGRRQEIVEKAIQFIVKKLIEKIKENE